MAQQVLPTGNSKDTASSVSSNGFKKWLKAFYAAFLALSVIMPLIASVVLAVLELMYQDKLNVPFKPTLQIWDPIVLGWFVTLIIWPVLAVFLSYFSYAEHADVRQYSMLESRLGAVKSQLELIGESDSILTGRKAPSEERKLELKKTRGKIDFCKTYINEKLFCSNPNLSWITGKEYLNLWRIMHYAEEYLLDFKPIDRIIQDALHDLLSIEKSSIDPDQRDRLRQKIKLAVKTLDPAALPYFNEKGYEEELERNDTDKEMQKKEMQKNAASLNNAKDINQQDEYDARAILREVRQQIFNFRDAYQANILHLRNQLIWAFALTVLGTYILLCLAIVFTKQPMMAVDILEALMLYAVGAVAGLSGRFYGELYRSSLPEDYGLSTTRLIATPFLSGLAAIGGVLITSFLAAKTNTSDWSNWSSFFTLNLFNLVIATIFGLTPNLLMQSLKKHAEALVEV